MGASTALPAPARLRSGQHTSRQEEGPRICFPSPGHGSWGPVPAGRWATPDSQPARERFGVASHFVSPVDSVSTYVFIASSLKAQPAERRVEQGRLVHRGEAKPTVEVQVAGVRTPPTSAPRVRPCSAASTSMPTRTPGSLEAGPDQPSRSRHTRAPLPMPAGSAPHSPVEPRPPRAAP